VVLLLRKEKTSVMIFFRTKPVRMLVGLIGKPKYATILSKEVDCTYSHTVKLLNLFESLGLVEFEKRGRIKIVKLTNLGEEIAKRMASVLGKLSKLKRKK
jgi:DNA-binding MarR family transcriptional regulator